MHVSDEEKDVFPALLAAADSPARRAQAFELVSRLLVEHRELAELWHALRVALQPSGPAAVELPPLPVFGGGGVLPGVDLASNAALRERMDEDAGIDALR